MNTTKTSVQDGRLFIRQFVFPAAFGVGVFGILFWAYYSSWYIDNRFVHFLLTDVVGAFFGFFLMFNVLFMYPIFYFRGASPRQRITGSFLITFFWSLKEIYRMTEFYSLGQSAFFLLFPIQSNIILMSFGFMGLSEMICRWITKKTKKTDIKIVTPLPVSTVITVLAIVIFTLHDGGVTYFFWYNDLFKYLFM